MAKKATKVVHNNGVEVKIIPANRLFVDPAYQRCTSAKRVKEIAANFDWAAVGILTVSKRPNGYAVIDGQTRFLGMLKRFPSLCANSKPIYLLCEVRRCSSLAAEAKVFRKLNHNQRNLKKNDDFHAALCAGDESATLVSQILEHQGISLHYGPGKLVDNQTRHLGLFLDVFEQLGKSRFSFMIKLLMLFYGDDGTIEKKALQAMFLRGLAKFVEEYTGQYVRTTMRTGLDRGLESGDSAYDIIQRCHLKKCSAGWYRDTLVADELHKLMKKGLKGLKSAA